jgi:hypothetical protein
MRKGIVVLVALAMLAMVSPSAIWAQKMEEYEEVRRRPHPYEIGLYYDV